MPDQIIPKSIAASALVLTAFGPSIQLQAEEIALEEFQIKEIVVTAEKKSAGIQEVPMSISAFSETKLNDSSIKELPEIARLSPNVYIKRESFIIRGSVNFSSRSASWY